VSEHPQLGVDAAHAGVAAQPLVGTLDDRQQCGVGLFPLARPSLGDTARSARYTTAMGSGP
jgi:hypothetical protein